jgi:hypothetical protein
MRNSEALKRAPLGLVYSPRHITAPRQLFYRYAEMLEDSNQTLVSVIKKLYGMLETKLNELREVRKNENREPIISDILEMLSLSQRASNNEPQIEFLQTRSALQKLRSEIEILEIKERHGKTPRIPRRYRQQQ